MHNVFIICVIFSNVSWRIRSIIHAKQTAGILITLDLILTTVRIMYCNFKIEIKI